MNPQQTHSKALIGIVIWMLLSLVLAACVHTDLPAQVVPHAPVGTAMVPLRVAVLNDPSLTIHQPWDFYEKLNPGMANVVRDALAANFERVELAETKESADDASLLAIPSSDVQFHSVPSLKLTVTFLDARTWKTVADLSSVKPFETDAPGTDEHSGTDLAMVVPGLLFPPLILMEEPTLQRHEAERFNAGFGPALVAMATDIADQASKDPAIVSLSNRQSTNRPPAP